MEFGLSSMLSDGNAKKRHVQKSFAQSIKKKDDEALQMLLDCPWGRWFLMRLFDRCLLFSDGFTGNSTTFFNEGMRKVGLMFLADIKALGFEGVMQKQLAEREYVQFQLDLENLLNKKEED